MGMGGCWVVVVVIASATHVPHPPPPPVASFALAIHNNHAALLLLLLLVHSPPFRSSSNTASTSSHRSSFRMFPKNISSSHTYIYCLLMTRVGGLVGWVGRRRKLNREIKSSAKAEKIVLHFNVIKFVRFELRLMN